MMFIVLLLLSPFEGALKLLRSNEKKKEKEKEKENEKKNKKEKKLFCQASLTLHVCNLKFLDGKICHGISDNSINFNYQTHNNIHDRTQLSNGMTVISQRACCLMRCLNRLGRFIFDDYSFTQCVIAKTSSLAAPDQPIKSST